VKIYIYGIIDSKGRIGRHIKGLRRTRVYTIPYRNISIVASTLNREIQDISSDRIVEHEIVVERLMENFAVLPVRFHTIFNSKKDVLTVISDYYIDFRENLNRLRNKAEFGIKVIWDGNAIRERIINNCPEKSQRMPVSGNSPAKSFIKEKFQKYKIDKEFKEEAERCIIAVDSFFSGAAAEKRLEKLKSENLLLSASYLVDKERQNDFKQSFEELKSTHSDFKYLFSGPWPPYNFIILKRKPIRQNISEADMINGIPLAKRW